MNADRYKNQPPDEYIAVREDRLLSFVTVCFERAGSVPEQAAVIARLLVDADLRGVRSHATRGARGYAMAMEQGSANPAPDIRIIHQTPATVVMDGDGAVGYWPMVQAAQLAVGRARDTSLGLALVRHIGHYGSAGHYSRICQAAGCVGISMQGYRNEGKSRNVDPKPSVGYSGDPPLSIAIPGGDEPGVVVDMGASVFGHYCAQEGYADLLERVPNAFLRSVGLIAVTTLLGGALTGFTAPEADATQERWPGAGMGGMVLAIDLDQVVDADLFRAEADRYTRDLQANYTPLPGTDGVRLPGSLASRQPSAART